MSKKTKQQDAVAVFAANSMWYKKIVGFVCVAIGLNDSFLTQNQFQTARGAIVLI